MNLQTKLEEESKNYIKNKLHGKYIEKFSWGEGGELCLFSDIDGKEYCLFAVSLEQKQIFLKDYYYQIVDECMQNDTNMIFCKKIDCKEVFQNERQAGYYIFIITEKVVPLIHQILDGKFDAKNNNQKKIKLLSMIDQACRNILYIKEKFPFINWFINYEEICINRQGEVKLLLFDVIKNQIKTQNCKNEIELVTKQLAKGLNVSLEELTFANSLEEFQENCKIARKKLIDKEKQYQDKFDKYLQLAKEGNSTAMKNLGYMYEKGKGVPVDYKKAVTWYEMAIEKNNPQAFNNLAHMYQKGNGVKKDEKLAIAYLEKSAEKGDSIAMFNLGIVYQTGKGVEKNIKTAAYWYKKSMKRGNEQAKRIYNQICSQKKR